MKSLGDMDLWDILGMDGNGSGENTPTGSTLDPVQCPICKAQGEERKCNGSGFYDLDVPVGHPDFSKVFRCPYNPPEFDDNLKDKLRALSNLGAYSEKTFDNFHVEDLIELSDQDRHSLDQAHRMAIEFAQAPDGTWLVLQGTYGCGKTHLAAAIGNARLGLGDMVLFITAPDLLDYLRSSYGPGAETYDTIFDRVRQANLLILDDLGTENPSEWAREKMFQLLNHRYSQRLPTVITSNADIDQLDPRLRSRMLDIEVVRHARITAPDYRTAQKNEQGQLSDLHMYARYHFDNFDAQTGCRPDEAQNLRRALLAAREYAHHPIGWFVFQGESGTGKTHLAAAIANQVAGEMRKEKAPVSFLAVSDLLDYLRRTFSPSSPLSFDAQFQQIKDAPLLVLDDLQATELNKPWAREKLLQVVKYRYVKELPTIITTPLTLEALDSQVRTRLMDQRICKIWVLDVRPYVIRTQGGL